MKYIRLPLSRVVVPLPAARRPTCAGVFVCVFRQLHGYGFQTARTNALVIRSRDQNWSKWRSQSQLILARFVLSD